MISSTTSLPQFLPPNDGTKSLTWNPTQPSINGWLSIGWWPKSLHTHMRTMRPLYIYLHEWLGCYRFSCTVGRSAIHFANWWALGFMKLVLYRTFWGWSLWNMSYSIRLTSGYVIWEVYDSKLSTIFTHFPPKCRLMSFLEKKNDFPPKLSHWKNTAGTSWSRGRNRDALAASARLFGVLQPHQIAHLWASLRANQPVDQPPGCAQVNPNEISWVFWSHW